MLLFRWLSLGPKHLESSVKILVGRAYRVKMAEILLMEIPLLVVDKAASLESTALRRKVFVACLSGDRR